MTGDKSGRELDPPLRRAAANGPTIDPDCPMSVVSLVRGVSPVLSVPFTDTGALDAQGFASVVDHVLGTGVSSTLLFGLVGEFAKLDDAERREILDVLVSRTAGRDDVAAIVSVTDHSADVAARRAKEYAEAGADVINIFPPFFLRPSSDQILNHVSAVCTAIDLPVVMQYAPSQTSIEIAPEQIITLADRHPNLTLIKVESQPPGRLVEQLGIISEGRLQCLIGYAGLQWPDAHVRGAVGVQPGCSATELYLEAQRLLDADDHDGFKTLHTRALPWLSYWMQGVELIVAVEKLVLQRRGIIDSAYCRRPAYALDQREVAHVESFLVEFGDLLMP